MSTRSRTRTASKTELSSSGSKSKSDHAKSISKAKDVAKSTKPTRSKTRGRKAAAKEVYCTCKMGDDGTPMVYCVECKDWYHFSCVNLKEEDAHDINLYICPSCTERTGLRSVMLWEGPDAVEELVQPTPATAPRRERTTTPAKKDAKLKVEDNPDPVMSEESVDNDSEDEYVVERKAKGKNLVKRRRLLTYSESDASSDEDNSRSRKSRRLRKASGSPGPKRKASNAGRQAPVKKPRISDANDDPARKYCLGKFLDVFRDIFLKYPFLHGEHEDDLVIEKRPVDLTEKEKEQVLAQATRFATELERCVYETYSEPDKQGIPHAGPKYKDRFRMLQFNLSKADRVVLHKRIASVQITPQEISGMSSTDLANEETKQSIKLAEKEALQHSILQMTVAPRAKITHKGLQDIEDVNDNRPDTRERERETELEERMERERLARVKSQRQRTQSISVPPESPAVVQSQASWGAPLPPPVLSVDGEQSARPSLFLQTESDLAAPEPEFNLADLINIDDEPATGPPLQMNSPIDAPAVSSPNVHPASSYNDAPAPATLPGISAAPSTPVGASPFASGPPKLETPRSASFDLNSLWSAAASAPESSIPSEPGPYIDAAKPEEHPKDDTVIETDASETHDQDFDMFLEEKDPSPEDREAAFEATPAVWSGNINMPLDSSVPQDTPVLARQMGGRPIEAGSPLWQTLFPSNVVRIDGRVATASSARFLLQIRMNPTKELIGVAFSPGPGTDGTSFNGVSEFLINKDRHGLVFPWGKNPREHHPGREMYIVPLLASSPLPDFIELLDDLKLPNIRTTNYMVGIWVLNRGKLAPPPPTPTPPMLIPNLSNSQPVLDPTALAALLPAPGPGAPPIDSSAIAAEVAALTPEQIQLMLRTLTSGPTPLIPMSSATAPPPPSSFQAPMTIPQPQPQSWGATGYPPGPSPPNVDPYSQHDQDYRRPGGPGYDRDSRDRGRPWRGRGRGRGRGGESPHKPVDSGWPRKGGRGGGTESAQRRW